MKKVIIARHGQYDGNSGLLDLVGCDQVRNLGQAMKDFTTGDGTAIISSTAPRAIQSSEILSEIFGIPDRHEKFLWSGPDCPYLRTHPNLDEAVHVIKSSWADVLILVTHQEYCENLPRHLSFRLKWKESDFPCEPISTGHAWVFDLETKKCIKIHCK